MATRYLVTRPSFIGDTLVYPGHTVDADADFVPSAHLVPQVVVQAPATVSVVKPKK